MAPEDPDSPGPVAHVVGFVVASAICGLLVFALLGQLGLVEWIGRRAPAPSAAAAPALAGFAGLAGFAAVRALVLAIRKLRDRA